MRLPDFARATSFRWAVGTAAAFTLCTLLLFGFVYLEAADYMISRTDSAIMADMSTWAGKSRPELFEAVAQRLTDDPRRIKLASLFAADGRRLIGNIETLPTGLLPEAPAGEAMLVRLDERGREQQSVEAMAHRMPDGGILVLARNIDETKELAEIVGKTLLLGLLPAAMLAVAVGAFLSRRANMRVEEVSRRVARIVAGDLSQRLPSHGDLDSFDRLATIVNGMLDRIETLVEEMAGVGNDIAHDLRTPLCRVRAVLERERASGATVEACHAAIDRAIPALDQCLAIITALLRITEIEHSRRSSAFREIAPADILAEVAELYAPMAEDRDIALRLAETLPAMVRGDRDLLFEAVANLVDNAVKFTPAGGRIDLSLRRSGEMVILQISDSGPGIGAAERDSVTKRFYRSDPSRHTPGVGLGLSLVAAIVRLHGFVLTFSDAPGCTIEIACPELLPHASVA